jgi:hypothetical protein
MQNFYCIMQLFIIVSFYKKPRYILYICVIKSEVETIPFRVQAKGIRLCFPGNT